MKSFIQIVLLFWSILGIGQELHRLDSLKKVLKYQANETDKHGLLVLIFDSYLFENLDSANLYKNQILELSQNDVLKKMDAYGLASKYHYYKYDIDSSLFFTKKALDLAIKIDSDSLQANNYRRLAILYSRKSDYENAEKYGKLALESSKSIGDWNLIASANTMLGNQFYKKNDYDIALKYYLEADSIYSANRDKSRFAAMVYDNIGSIYAELKDERALHYIDKAFTTYSHIDDEEGKNYSYILKAIYYQTAGNSEKAIENLETAREFYENYGNSFRTKEIYGRLINNYSSIGEYQKAEKYLKKSESLISDSDTNESKLELAMNAGQLYVDQAKYQKAIDYFNEAKSIIEEGVSNFQLSYIREINKGLAKSYEGIGNYKLAYLYQQNQLSITDSINKKNNIELTKDLEAKYQNEKKEQQIALLKFQNELAEQKQKSQRNLLLGGIGLTSLAGLFLFVLYRNRQKTNKKLRELDAAKSNFFANISHELRTPLTLIKGPLDAQLENDGLTSAEKQNLSIAKNNTERLETLVDQLLDLSKLESGYYSLQASKGDLSTFLRSLSELFLYQAQQKGQQLDIAISDDQKKHWYDQDVLQKIVTNLLSNALKYSPEKASITFRTTLENDSLSLLIKNTGISLSKEELEQIFNRFHRRQENETGTGIGLALTKELVELHKGTIRAESDSDSVRFLVELPIGDSAFGASEKSVAVQNQTAFDIVSPISTPSEEIASIKSRPNGEQPILLVVDDNADVRAYVSTLFDTSFHILTAENGKTGFQSALEHVPDLIITDLMMPEDDGLKLTENCKTHDTTSHIPIIMLTAKAGDENRLEGLETGADAYLTKPFNTKILKQTVNNLLESRKKLQERFSREVILTPKEISIGSYDERFLNALQEVLDNQLVESDFNVEAFAKALGMSRMQLHRKLKALTGQTATEFIRSQRLKLAADLLKKSDANVSEIGYTVGFNNHSHFTKCFKEQFGVAPSEYTAS